MILLEHQYIMGAAEEAALGVQVVEPEVLEAAEQVLLMPTEYLQLPILEAAVVELNKREQPDLEDLV